MRRSIILALLVVAACSHAPSPPSEVEPAPGKLPPPRILFAEPDGTRGHDGVDDVAIGPSQAEASAVRVGASVVSVVGTPVFAMLKAAVCVTSVALAAPLAGLNELSQDRRKPKTRRELHEGVGHNCGGSYALTAY